MFCMVITLFGIVSVFGRSASVNNRPIVGVMMQRSPSDLTHYGEYYLPATYVKFIESAGARVVPIFVDEDDTYYDDLFKSINGMLLPGGGLDEDLITSGYGKAGAKIYNMAKKYYDDCKDSFPIWGTCQGFELLATLAANESILVPLKASDENLNLNIEKGYDSRILGNAPDWLLKALEDDAITYNVHHFSVTPTDYHKSEPLNSTFNIVATSTNDENRDFIAIMEAKKYPFYGVQFHPEKPIFAWSSKTNIKHDSTSVIASRYFADFFIGEVRKNTHQFRTEAEEKAALIYNYKTENVNGTEDLFDVYFFPQ